ncbi:hybrid sensor histidine kinase/response regulator [Aquabacterium sp. OR-4]|uniref:hybrid sensor histidine kinase/response regulator n=1 Tax=Aquabacterium sp. OR-4 TaxID=2978127 RepID=UPI0028C865FF|nr:ATP-binding protein [Aquabacterium sp. OR-4]MDT7835048.1 ATP-binding protein [Aquabacterium sp. OR-4]
MTTPAATPPSPSPAPSSAPDVGLARLPCGWLRLDAKGIVTAANPALGRLLGVDPATLPGRPFDSLLSRPSRVLYQSYLQPLLRLHGNVEEFSLAFDLGQGQTLDALVYTSAAPASEPGAAVVGGVEMVLASVRKRRGIEDEMLRIKRAADHAPGMIFQLMQLADGSCRFTYTSEAVRHMYGVSAQQVAESAERLLGQLSPGTRLNLSRHLRQAAEAEQEWHAVFEVFAPGGAPRWHEARATPRRLANGVTLWHGHCADVTDKRALERAMADRLAMEKSHQARSEFLARVSHELRTPLNGILGFAQLLATDRADNLSAEQRDRLAVLSSSGRHLLALVNELLEVSSLETGQLHVPLQPLALQPLLEVALQGVRQQAAEAQVQLLPTLCPPGLWVHSNERRLLQVLANLLSNAIKYNRPGGTVQFMVQGDAQGVILTVQDSGKGISDEQRESLFQPFNRLGAENTAVRGHGLGLVISKHLLDLMGAEMAVSSKPGIGSRFSILMHADAGLPAGEGAPPAAPPPPPGPAELPPADSRVSGGHVLYVEDDEVNGILMSAVLGMRPMTSLQLATSGAQALEMAQAGGIDLLLIDMHLPDTLGIDLLAALRQIDGLQTVPAIMVSAGARQQDMDRALACGFVDYWTKPLDTCRTLAALDALLKPAAAVPANAPR